MEGLLVDALFRDDRSLVIGSATAVGAIATTAAKTGSLPIAACAALLAGVAALRLLHLRAYRRVTRPLPATVARRWELGYGTGAAAHGLVLGLWCFLCLATTDDRFAQLLSAVVTIGCASAIPGRNFGRVGIATVQILCLCVPLSLGWLIQGDRYYLVLTLVTLPFFAALRIMSVRLHGMLIEALTATSKLDALSRRFDAAVSNMPHGLCMLDAGGRLLVHNPRFGEVLGLPSETLMSEAPLAHALARLHDADPHATVPIEQLLAGSDGGSGSASLALVDGRSVVLTVQSLAEGGAVVVAEDVTQRRQAENRIVHLARFDAVTDLANRAYFLERLPAHRARAAERGETCTLFFIDLDRFKVVNDSFGHACGDRLLRAVAERLAGVITAPDLVGRFGGDEFVAVLALPPGPDAIAARAAAIIDRLAEPFVLDGHGVRVAASIGVAPGDVAASDAELLHQADIALYRAKSTGRGRWCLYEPAMDLEALKRRALEADLQAAVAARGFEVHYQPLVNLDTMRIETCEALLRWPHAQRGMISPAEFIPVAEEIGLIADLGAFVLRTACIECQRWPADKRVAVNLSPAQFETGDVVAVIKDALWTSGLSPKRLEVEITETVLIEDPRATRATLRRIQDLGVAIVLDDFGTGYSSLSYLHSFPLQKIKLDRSFLADVLDDARSFTLLDSIGELSQRLGLTVVVEGIETDAQMDVVRSMRHVDEAQGYLLGRPVPRERIRQLLDLPETGVPSDHCRRLPRRETVLA